MIASDNQARAVTFRIGEELYAVDVQCVERVVRYVTPRHVPRLPAWIEGIIELDGRVIPVVDLRRRLGSEGLATSLQTRLLLLAVNGDWCGMIVDQVMDVRAYAPADLAPPPALVRGRGSALVLLLDAPQLFTDAERESLEANGVAEAWHA